MTTFADLRLSDAVLSALRDVGYESPSPIQEQAIPELLQGKDVIGQAQTGTGKTAAFGLPMIDFVDPDDPDTQALVLTPTRELCIQVTQALRTYGKYRGIDPVAVFGGAPIRTQQAQLKQGAQVVVGTVGRVLDLISRHSLVLHACRYMVLDEADEMLDLGFLEDVEKILALTPNGRQTALFSATMPNEIRGLAARHLYDPVTVKVKSATLTIDTVEQFYVEVKQADKTEMLARVLEAEQPAQAIVFVRTKIRCEQLYRTLRDRGMNVKALHGDMTQGGRDGVMISFKDERVKILVATDVAARGLDISTVTHIVNFDVPTSPDVYVHRIGRTGRVGRSGRAITFVEPRQARELAAIEKHANTKISPWAEGARVAR
jgi:ATP-dependent RNA helicase DeaD